MALQDMINSFQNKLNRDDCSSTQAQAYVQDGIARLQREARLPSMERELDTTATGPLTWIGVPSDLLEIIDVLGPSYTDGRPRPLTKLTYRELLKVDPNQWPKFYARWQGQIFIAGTVATGQVISVLYYGQFTAFASLTAENELSLSSPDVAIYAALSLAADDFVHPSGKLWEDRYQQLKGELESQAADLENNGGPAAIQPIYGHGGWD